KNKVKKVVVYRTLQKKQLDFLKSNFDISYFPDIASPLNDKDFLEAMKTADALFGAGLKVTKELLDQSPNLKVISNFSAGFDNLDLKLLSESGIVATNAPDALVDTVPDLIFSLILTVSRSVGQFDKFIRKVDWNEKSERN